LPRRGLRRLAAGGGFPQAAERRRRPGQPVPAPPDAALHRLQPRPAGGLAHPGARAPGGPPPRGGAGGLPPPPAPGPPRPPQPPPRHDSPPLSLGQAGGLRFPALYLPPQVEAGTLTVRPCGQPPSPSDPADFLAAVDRTPLDDRQVDLLLVVPPDFREQLERG